MGTQPLAVGQLISLTIDRLAYHSGHGVGRYDGFVVFVPFTAPGDEAEVEVRDLHRTYAIAGLRKILSPSPHRREPPCPVAGRCGGCQWQQVTYEEQIHQKDRLLRDSLRNLQAFGAVEFRPLRKAPEEFRYRNRIQVHRHGTDVGFYAAGTHELIPVDDCWIAETAVAQGLRDVSLRAHLPQALPEERIGIARRNNGTIELSDAPGECEGRFAQVNTRQNEALIELVLAAVHERAFDTVVDLYCGAGNFTLPLAEALSPATVHGVEHSRELIRQAKKLTTGHPADGRLHWHAQSTADFLKTVTKKPQGLVVLDPPRPGCDRATREGVRRISPRQIVYVSCNPSTLGRDLEYWLKGSDYRVEFA